MKYDKGQLTFDFKRTDSYLPLIAAIIFVMFVDNFLYVGNTRQTDHKISFIAAGLFAYAFIYLLHHYFPSEQYVKTHKDAKDEVDDKEPDKIFTHEDEASRVELTINRIWKKVPIEDRDTDEEYDDEPSPSKRTKKRNGTSSSSSGVLMQRKDKLQEKIRIKFKSWSKHPDRWHWKYWFGWLGYESNKIDVLKTNDGYEF